MTFSLHPDMVQFAWQMFAGIWKSVLRELDLETYLMSLLLLLSRQKANTPHLFSRQFSDVSSVLGVCQGNQGVHWHQQGLAQIDPDSLISLFPQENWPEQPQSTHGQIYVPASELRQTIQKKSNLGVILSSNFIICYFNIAILTWNIIIVENWMWIVKNKKQKYQYHAVKILGYKKRVMNAVFKSIITNHKCIYHFNVKHIKLNILVI